MSEKKGMRNKWIIAIACIAIVVVAGITFWYFALPATLTPSSKLKVAMLATGAESAPWNVVGTTALAEANKTINFELSKSFDLAFADLARVMKDYAELKYDLVIGWGIEFVEPTRETAPGYPDVKFAFVCSSILPVDLPNIAGIQITDQEPSLLTGLIAGGMTNTSKVGSIGAMPVPDEVPAMESFKVGVRIMSNDTHIGETYLGSWFDLPGGKEAAIAQIQLGADFIHQDGVPAGLGVIEACEERNVLQVGAYIDQSIYAPDTMVACALLTEKPVMIDMLNAIIDGQWETKIYRYSMAEGGSDITGIGSSKIIVPAELKNLVAKVRQDIIDKKLVVPYEIQSTGTWESGYTPAQFQDYINTFREHYGVT